MGHGFLQGPMHKLEDQSETIKRARWQDPRQRVRNRDHCGMLRCGSPALLFLMPPI
jgi:hypothetical protein